MGIGRRIAFSGGGAILAIIAVGLIATKTDILQKFSSGLGSIGSSIGRGVGLGVANIPKGVVEGTSEVFRQGGFEDPLGLKKAYNDWLISLGLLDPKDARIKGGIIPFDYGNQPPIAGDDSPDGFTVTQASRDLSDVSKSRFGNVGTLRSVKRSSSGSITSVSRSVSKAQQRSNPRFASAKAKAVRKSKARKSGKCFNYELDMGGVGQHTYRSFGVIPLHG